MDDKQRARLLTFALCLQRAMPLYDVREKVMQQVRHVWIAERLRRRLIDYTCQCLLTYWDAAHCEETSTSDLQLTYHRGIQIDEDGQQHRQPDMEAVRIVLLRRALRLFFQVRD